MSSAVSSPLSSAVSSTSTKNTSANPSPADDHPKTDDQIWDDLLQSPEGKATLKSLVDEAEDDFESGDFEED